MNLQNRYLLAKDLHVEVFHSIKFEKL
jgi:uncharacterized protein with PIN domain